MGNQEN